jgi:hypothetical protein
MRNTANLNPTAIPAPSAESQPAPPAAAVKELFSNDRANPDRGGRWVAFEYCLSFVVVTLRRTSRPRFIADGDRAWVRGLPYCLISLFFGWWGVPWGLVYTPVTIFANLTGGCDITAQLPPETPVTA